jgi:hypothetical protein
MEVPAYQIETFKSIIFYVNYSIQTGAFFTFAPN